MTSIVAYKDEEKFYIAGDRRASYTDSDRFINLKTPKIFQKNDMLFGCCGLFKYAQVLQHIFQIPARQENIDDMEYMIAHFIPALHDCFVEYHVLRYSDESERRNEVSIDGEFIVCYKDHIYTVGDNLDVTESEANYTSSGSGSQVSLGVIIALEDIDMSIEEKLIKSIEACELVIYGVGGKVDVLSMPLNYVEE